MSNNDPWSRFFYIQVLVTPMRDPMVMGRSRGGGGQAPLKNHNNIGFS